MNRSWATYGACRRRNGSSRGLCRSMAINRIFSFSRRSHRCVARVAEVPMSTLYNLTLQTAAAVGRLADLQRRAASFTKNSTTITNTALGELSGALEELQVANEALQRQVDELNALRLSNEHATTLLDEFSHALPVAAVWTDYVSDIEKGNDAACRL